MRDSERKYRAVADRDFNQFLRWTIVTAVVVPIVLAGVGIAVGYIGVAGNRIVVQESRQYAETNTEAFYDRLEAVNKIDVQLTTADDRLVSALKTQRELLISEMKREVAKIPHDAQTPDMVPYR